MMNWRLIDAAVSIARDYFEANHISVTNQCIREQAYDWYCGTEIVDPEELAAVIIAYGNFKDTYTYQDIVDAHNEYFPTEPIKLHNISIYEIEMAQHDMEWM